MLRNSKRAGNPSTPIGSRHWQAGVRETLGSLPDLLRNSKRVGNPGAPIKLGSLNIIKMSKFKQHQSSVETEAEELKRQRTEVGRPQKPILKNIEEDKKTIDSKIYSEVQTIQKIFNSLEREEVEEIFGEKTIADPKKLISEITTLLSTKEDISIDDIYRILIVSGLKTQDVQSWLTANKTKIQSLVAEEGQLESKRDELSLQLTEEENWNFFAKLLHKKEQQETSDKLTRVSDQIEKLRVLREKEQSRTYRTEAIIQEISEQKDELTAKALEQLFQDVSIGYKKLHEQFTSPAVKQELNNILIDTRVIPELDGLILKEKISKENAEEYVRLIKIQLAEGDRPDWNDPIEKKQAIATMTQRIEEINQGTGYNLTELTRSVNSDESKPADEYYDKIFELLFKQIKEEKIEELRDTLLNMAEPELQTKIINITDKTTSKDALDLNGLPIENFDRLGGLGRWRAVKKLTKSAEIIPQETFAQIEKLIVQRLFNEQLSPGGRESWNGTSAARTMGELGNPEALPLMLRHIESSGVGHTNNAVVYEMENLLQESDPEELERVLSAMPKNKRIMLETLADKNSYISRFGRTNSRYTTCGLLQNGNLTLAREKLTKILEGSGQDEEKLKDFYLLQGTENAPEFLELLLKEKTSVESIIIDSKLSTWAQSADKLLSNLVNPRNEESSTFPKRIAQEGLDISDEKLLETIDRIFKTKTMTGSGFEREAFLDGLILLNSKENGKYILETLLKTYRGSKDDPVRMRHIFQLLSTLDSFGGYEFITPDQRKAHRVSREIAVLEKQSLQTEDKSEKKKIKNMIQTLNNDLNNLTGLKGIEGEMTQKVIEVACRKLELPEEYRKKMENNLDELLKSGIFEIVPALAGKYEAKNETEVGALLKKITMQIISGDFREWRYSHEQSGIQLAGLTDEQKEFWKANLDPINIEIEFSEDENDKRTDELKAVQEIIRNAKEHILDSQPNFDFSKERVRSLTSKIKELTEEIKTSASEENKQRVAEEKRQVQAELNLTNGILEIENATPRSFTRGKIMLQARELRDKITELDLPLAGLDIDQIGKIFTVGDIKNVTAYESDDPLTLLRVGVEPQETCQSWRSGGYNECLLSYVADSNKKVLNITDGEGRVVARSMIKLTNQREKNDFDSKTKRPTLLVERPYSLLPNKEVYRTFIKLLLTKARGLGTSITFGRGFDHDTIELFKEEARDFGYTTEERNLDIYIPQSMNKYEYSDTLGGKISWFNRYQPLDGAVTLEPSK